MSTPLTDVFVRDFVASAKQVEVFDAQFSDYGSLGVRFNPAGKKVFFYLYSLNGRRRRLPLGGFPELSVSEARARASDAASLVSMGRDPAAERRIRRSLPTMESVTELYLGELEKIGRAASTLGEYRRIAQREILPRFGNMRIDMLEVADFAALLNEIELKRESLVMAARVQSLLRSILDFASARGFIEKEKFSELPTVPRVDNSPRFLSLEQIRSLWHVLSHEKGQIAGVIRVILVTLQSPGAVMGMRWSDILLDTWHPESAQRSIYLVNSALETLKNEKVPGHPYVFRGRGSHHVAFIRRAFKGFLAKAQLPTTANPDLLRRSGARELGKLGVRPDVVDYLLNRRQHRQTDETPPYDYRDDIRMALTRWEVCLESNMEKYRPLTGELLT